MNPLKTNGCQNEPNILREYQNSGLKTGRHVVGHNEKNEPH